MVLMSGRLVVPTLNHCLRCGFLCLEVANQSERASVIDLKRVLEKLSVTLDFSVCFFTFEVAKVLGGDAEITVGFPFELEIRHGGS